MERHEHTFEKLHLTRLVLEYDDKLDWKN